MIEVDALTWARGGFDLELSFVAREHVTGVFGASGSGKTTLLELIAGIRRPSGGLIRAHGEVFVDCANGLHRVPESRNVGYVPQDAALFPHLNVEENLRYGAPRDRLGGRRPSPEFAFDRVCQLLGIKQLLRAAPVRLSGGERQRVALGRALLSHPRLLLLDEPLAGLDRARKEAILPYLARVRHEFSLPMLYVSHAAEEMVSFCDEVLVLERGRLISQGRPVQVFVPENSPTYRLRG